MIQANEIRVGNLVTWVDDNENESVLTVTGIMLGGDIWVEWEWEGNEKDDTDCDTESIKGIPLTGEWLNKLGFDKTAIGHSKNISYFKDQSEFKTMCVDMNQGVAIRCGQMSGSRSMDEIIYVYNTDISGPINVHQLQNLYFALTGKELTLPQ